ncbi:hypothetical protein [Methanoregula formicica]|uniref:Uncharacterized protein n=1 Tax=Methanoregula formicica (strain DSM 22288 / NBRC 105244 / SMSP) TaxID=593750 RepID=L0HDG8_METFS|nr:hypothetical protein [Methanoregula formicica]AGB01139.1 hypothetical protein Metfor_0053 [Methanoregula formicica SMSP]
MPGLISLFSPYAKLGNIYRVEHHNKHGVSLPRLLRRSWIVDTPKSKRDKKIIFIVGECSLVQNIQEAIYNGYSVEIITGPKLRNVATKEKLKQLKIDYPDKLTLMVAEERPEKHFCIINGNILYEDPHSDVDNYGCATAVENAEKENISLVKKYFEEYKNKRRIKIIATPEEIGQLNTIE